MGRRVTFGRLAALGIGALVARALWRRFRAIDLWGRTVLITGASRGLGLALAEEFALAGANLVICGRDPETLEAARARLEDLGAPVEAVPCDVGDPGQVDELVRRGRERFGGIDVVVNNAGILTVGPLDAQTEEDLEASLDVMLRGILHTTQAVLPQMRERGEGRIVNVTSIGGRVSAPHLLSYSAAKFGAVGLSQGLRAELAPEGIRVVTVIPGFMRTGSQLHAMYAGRPRAEFAWFLLFGTAPLISASARRAAQRIVAATRRGDPELIITPLAWVAVRASTVAPNLTARLLALFHRALPSGDEGWKAKGHESESGITKSPLGALGHGAARRYQWMEAGPNGGRGER